MVTWENYEEYMMLYADDELDETETGQLLAFVNLHPELQAELKAYAAAKLQPDAAEIYDDKASLLKPVPAKRIIAWKPWRMAAAAGMMLVLGFAALKWYHHPVGNDQAGFAATNIRPLKYQADLPVATPRDTQRRIPVHHKTKAVQRSSAAPASQPVIVLNQPYIKTTTDPVDPDLAAIHPAGSHVNTTPAPAPGTVARISAIPQPVVKKHDGLAWLPVSEERKEGLSVLGDAINERVEQVKKIKKDLNETSLVLSFGKKEIVINF